MRERARALVCALLATGVVGCGAGAPPPTPVSFLRQVEASAAQAASGSEGSAGDLSAIVAAATGTYGVTRSFNSNVCGFGDHSGEATVSPATDGGAFGLRMRTDATGLNDIEYSVLLRPDGNFSAVADATPRFVAQMSGRVQHSTLEFLEEIRILDESSPCHGHLVQARVTATKR